MLYSPGLEVLWLHIKNDKSQLYSLEVTVSTPPLRKQEKWGWGKSVTVTINCSVGSSKVEKLREALSPEVYHSSPTYLALE